MHLTAAEWARIEVLFPQLAELSGPERARFLERECADEPRVRAELEAMIAAAETEDVLLDRQIELTSTEARPAVEELAAGTRMGSWKIRSLIGHGGMGEVYLAERADGAYAMNAAIKLLKKELFSYDSAQRFLRERRVLARLSHPNIARVLDAGTTDDGRPFLVMEYVNGARVTDFARARNLFPTDAARLMLAVAEAVAEAHRRGVVHRDLKPANVMVDEEQQVKLLDFGIARLMDEDDSATPGVLPMTPAYAAPEQVRGQALTPAADVYALGVMLFQLLTQRMPHTREGMPLPVIAAGLDAEAPDAPSRAIWAADGLFPARERRRRADAMADGLDGIVLKALRADPARRYANAGEFATELRRWLDWRPSAVRKQTALGRARRWLERFSAPAPTSAPGDYKYWAFISYSHQDEPWAQWLHRTLETYRVPRRLVGRPLGDETTPRRLFPVFRDRDELASSHELGAVINQALRQSRNLIVVCSPRSATSRWVNEEIKAFRALGRGSRIFCLIVDGEPHASAKPEIAFSECFAPALRDKGIEPIAADARARKDGKAGSKLKLLAGILGVGLDELKQREKQRALRQRIFGTAAALALVGVIGGITQWFGAQREAREREIRIEKLVENGRLELLDGRNARAAVYLNEALKLGHDTVPLRYMLARAMEPIDALTNVRIHHGGTVLRAAFSPDGTKIAMAVRIKDEVVGKIYDASNGEELEQFTGLPKQPRVLLFFADSARLYVSGFQKFDNINGYFEEEPVTGVWRSGTPAPLLFVQGGAGRNATPLHPDGNRFLVATKSGLEIWDGARAERVGVIARGRQMAAASYSADGARVVTGDEKGAIEVWDASSGRRVVHLPGAEGLFPVAALFFPDGAQALVATASGDVRIWTLAQGKLRLAFLADPQTLIETKLNADGRRLLTIGIDGYKVWSTSRGLLAFSINRGLRFQEAQQAASAALTHDGNFLFTADSESPVAEAWGVLGKSKLYSLDLHAEHLNYVVLDADDRRLLLASGDGQAEIWNARIRPRLSLELRAPNTPYTVRFSPGSNDLLVGGGPPDSAYLSLIPEGASPKPLAGHRLAVLDATFSSDGKHLLTAGNDGTARWWDTARAQTRFELNGGADSMHIARVSADGRRGVTATGVLQAPGRSEKASARCLLWDLTTGKQLAVLEHTAAIQDNALAFDGTGTRLVTGDGSGAVKLWDAESGSLLREFPGHTAGVSSVAFSSDDKRVVTASVDKSIRVWDAESGRQLSQLVDPAFGAWENATFSPDGRTIAVATQSAAVGLWSPASGTLTTMKGHDNKVRWLRFLHGGALLLSASNDGSVRVWDALRGTGLGKAAQNRFQVFSFDVNNDATLLATASKECYTATWGIGLERRGVPEIDALLACRAPWQLVDDQLKPRAIEARSCAAGR